MQILQKNGALLRLYLALMLALFPLHAEAKIELLDRVIAVVDSGVVMESELNKRVKDIVGRLKEEGTELPTQNVLEEQVLERLIVEEIQMQIADRAGIKISDSEYHFLNIVKSILVSILFLRILRFG